jgi:hypothetical protein
MHATLKFTGILGVALALVALLTAGTLKIGAIEANAQTTIASVYAWQQNHSEFARTLPGLLEEAEGNITPTANASISYRVSTAADHYVFAQEIGSRVLVASDTHRFGVACDSYDASCVSKVTRDASLVEAPALWAVAVGKRQQKLTDYLGDDVTRSLPKFVVDLLNS